MDLRTAWVVAADPDMRPLIRLNLDRRGFEVFDTSPQGAAERPSTEPPLIIFDVGGTDESGWQAVEALRESPTLEGTRIILLVAAAPATRRLERLQPGRSPEKPLDMDALLGLVQQNLGERGV